MATIETATTSELVQLARYLDKACDLSDEARLAAEDASVNMPAGQLARVDVLSLVGRVVLARENAERMIEDLAKIERGLLEQIS